MAIGWLTILKTVPWSDVISNAPRVAEGAMKLWHRVAKKPSLPADSDVGTEPASSAEPQGMAALEKRVAVLQAEVSDLQAQMVASSELIKALADQNAQLIQRIDSNRSRVWWLSAATAVLAAAAVAALLFACSRAP